MAGEMRVDEMGIKFLIMKDIIRKLSQAGGVCGYELGFSTQPMTPVPDLIQSSHLTSILNEGVNLTQTPVPTIPLTSVTNRKSPLAPTGFSVHNNGVGKPQVEAKSEETRDARPVENILATSTIPSATSTIPSENQKNASQEPSEEATTAEESPPQEGNMRLFFKPKKPRSFVPGAAKRALPIMPPPGTAKIARTARTTGSPKKVAKFAGRMAKVSAPKQHVLLSQKPSVDKPSEESSAASSVTTQPPVVGLQKPTFPLVGHDTLVSPVVTTQQPMASHAQQPLLKHVKQPMFIHVQQPALKHAQQPMLTQAQQPALKHAQQPMLIHAQQPALKHAQQPVLIHAQQPALKYAQQPMLTQAVPHHIPKTNKSSSNATPVPSRFSREALQEIALNQHWHKVTVNDLKLWLRQQSVGVTAKDKKADLIEKTKKALNVEATP
ncbi:unnamed protein product [Cyprideis torosa]|uniref:Uncharacterized protein n=1 Tax=Cyprideis torosa TaxID=163714 RepID=A0A7R8ZLR1_9CRUS|nr:unnamed protein product [Cyprideis torosa]CAG0893843.1 unnamed protein product [Cyprideis torosa]